MVPDVRDGSGRRAYAGEGGHPFEATAASVDLWRNQLASSVAGDPVEATAAGPDLWRNQLGLSTAVHPPSAVLVDTQHRFLTSCSCIAGAEHITLKCEHKTK